ncbi:MAG: RsmD family RNA methyltransferase [Candidatus Methanofastidiosia archaeon]|jgi:tRNA (guanine37-N1)-methyltransferase
MTGYTRIGDIAIVYIPEESAHKEQEIAQYILRNDHSIKVVLRKYGRYGEFRKQKIKLLAGNHTETTHTEFGLKIQVDVKETYFSEREKTERQRLKDLVINGESILVLFAGVGAIPLVIAQEKRVDITAVEKNEKAFLLMKENILLNNLQGEITPVLQDVYTFEGPVCDRVIVPQPYNHSAFEYVQKFVKKGGVLHYYTWHSEHDSPPEFPGFSIITVTQVMSYAPRVWKVCVDLQKI